ncbi:MAG: chromosome segregation protein SMC [Candidatus Eisenbacteria bacterium]|nr:chromosome segregation protein SMC [Candidatus Eisenbacteria bacterium]
MFVDKLEVFGFKSFSQRLELSFGSGISGVIGPNGCGKSNVVDAFRWVLGEQSTKQLRGDKMEDVIFNGTRDIRPLSMAEVHLTLVNDKGILPVEFDTVTVGRRLYRSGQSEYTINRQPCRLKDVRDLFLDTGMGSHAYSVIERQMVDNVLSDNTGHRRFLFEEASGIMKYKTRKKEALGKLEATQTDLTRLSDIIHEVGRETESLKRQVGKAERYREIRGELKKLELSLYYRRLSDLSVRLGSLADSGATLSSAELAAEAALIAAEGRLEQLRLESIMADRLLSGAREDLARLDGEITDRNHRIMVLSERDASTRQRIDTARERIAILSLRREENEAEGIRAEEARKGHEAALSVESERLTSLDGRFRELDNQFRERREDVGKKKQLSLDLFQERMKREGDLRQCLSELAQIEVAQAALEVEKSGLTIRRDEIMGRLTEGQEAVAEQIRQIESANQATAELVDRIGVADRRAREEAEVEALARQEAAGVTSSLNMLENLRRSYEGFDPGVRRIMLDHGQEEAVLGTVADLVRVPAEWVEALRPVLGGWMQHVVTRNVDDARALIRNLSDESAGYVNFLPLDRLVPQEHPLLPTHPGVIGQARNFVTAPAEVRVLVDHLLGDVLVVDHFDRALELAADEQWSNWRFVTADGEMLDGVRLGGGKGGDRSGDLLEREREIANMGARLEELELDIKRHERARQEALGERIVADTALEEVRRRVNGLLAERAAREAEVGRLTGERNGVDEREADLILREASHLARREALSDNRHRLEGALHVASDDSQTAEDAYHREETGLALLDSEREASRSVLQETRIAAATREAALSECRERLERVRSTARELAADNERCLLDVTEGEERLIQLAEDITILAVEVERLHGGRDGRVLAVAEKDRVVADLNVSVETAESAARETRKAASELREQAHGEELLRTELKGEWRNLEVRLYEDYDLSTNELLLVPRDWPVTEAGEDAVLEVVETDVVELKDKLKRLGPVNLLAIEEYEEKSTRLTFLKEQFDDLIRARDSLNEAIQQINTTAAELFLSTFRQVQENFQKTFLVLFQGGECSLALVGDDPLECEIEIVAKPRGKRPQSIAQLSSGERALTAIALLFAIYLVKPSPFCILDEVDAPLDDANVDRFVAMIREFSSRTQFIVITHNKKTMEACDTLYGVTMQTPGISQVVSVKLSEAEGVLEGRKAVSGRAGILDAREMLPAMALPDGRELARGLDPLAGRAEAEENDRTADPATRALVDPITQ